MVVAAATISLPPFPAPPIFKSKPINHATNLPNQSLRILSPPRTHYTPHHLIIPPRATANRLISATPNGFFLLSEANPPENSDQIVSGDGDGASIVISVLLTIAFVGLSILTIGVIYIAVTDYLQKREKEKFEKEEAENAKKRGKKKRVRARAGPRGFGQKIDEDDDL